jgi:hypothetical protein
MIFSNFARTESGTQIMFKNALPIENIGSIKFYKDDSKGSFSKKEFRWSFNGSYWASWETLNQGNFSAIDIKGHLFVEVRYIKTSITSTVTTFSITYMSTGEVTTVVSCNNIKDYDNTCCVENTTLINSDLLNQKAGSYYLWRPNQKGTQPISSITNLQNILNQISEDINDATVQGAENADGTGVGVYYNRIGKTLVFKRVTAGNKTIVTDTSYGQIKIDVDDASFADIYTRLGSLSFQNVGGGEGEIYRGRTGDNFYFRTLTAANDGVSIETDGDQIKIGVDGSIIKEIWTDPTPVSATIGGITKGFILDGSSSIKVLETMLYQYFPPTITLIADPSPGYYEKYGTMLDVSLYGSFNNLNFTKVRVTDVSACSTLLPSGFGHASYSDVSSGTFAFNDSTNTNWQDNIYTLKFNNNVEGKTMPIADASVEYKYVIPYIWGVVDDSVDVNNIDASALEYFHSLGQTILCKEQSNKITFEKPLSINKARFLYAYDASYDEIESIIDVKNDGLDVIGSFDVSTIDISLYSHSVPYKFYISNNWNDVSTFKLIFNTRIALNDENELLRLIHHAQDTADDAIDIAGNAQDVANTAQTTANNAYYDDTLIIKNRTTSTKSFSFDANNLTSGINRVLTIPDRDVSIDFISENTQTSVSGLLFGDSSGNVVSASEGTDYQAPIGTLTAGKVLVGNGVNALADNVGSYYITSIGLGNVVSPTCPLDITGSALPVMQTTRTTALTSGTVGNPNDGGVASCFVLTTKTSGNMADGFGGAFLFYLADDTYNGTPANAQGRIYCQRDGADNQSALVFLTKGTNTVANLIIRESTNNIGIGINTPLNKLDINGSMGIPQTGTIWSHATLGTLANGDTYLKLPSTGVKFGSRVAGNEVDYMLVTTSGNICTLRGQYQYHRQTLGVDTVNDIRTYTDGTNYYIDKCTQITPTVVWTNKQSLSLA